jgi:hypothetical protein
MKRELIVFLWALAGLCITGLGNAQELSESEQLQRKAETVDGKHEQRALRLSGSSSIRIVPADVPAPKGMVNVTLQAGDVWGDGSGYQMLIDTDAEEYGNTIPAGTGAIYNNCSAPATLYDVFEYRIPENANPVCAGANMVLNGSVTIQIPAGTCDFCFVNPQSGRRLWIASTNETPYGRYNDFVFEDGYSYLFEAKLDDAGLYDYIDLSMEVSVDEGMPAAVTALAVTPGAVGALTAALSWTNPSTTFGGETLAELTAVNIYNGYELVHTITAPQTGAAATHTVTVDSAAIYTFKVVPVSAAGSGAPAKASAYIGADLPEAPTNVTLTADGDNGAIAWTAPETGLNGGWFDESTLTYTVTRLPDNVDVATELTETGYTDNTIAQPGHFSYRITSVNSKGTGGSSTSEEKLLGGSVKLPYNMSFENTDGWQLWKIVNDDNTGLWARYEGYTYAHTGSFSMRYNSSTAYPGNDWIISPKIPLEAGKAYKIKFWTRVFSSLYPEKLELYLASDQTPESVIGEAVWVNDVITSGTYVEFETAISATSGGDYCFAFRCFSAAGMTNLYFDDFSIDVMPDAADAASTALYGTLTPMAGKPFTYRTVIKNEGSEPLTDYTVTLIDSADNVLATADTGADIAIGGSAMIDLDWTPETAGDTELRAVIAMTGDSNSDNNTTAPLNITVQPDAALFEGTIGNGTLVAQEMPIHFYYQNSAVQTIYYAHELMNEKGAIVELKYFQKFNTTMPEEGKPVRVLMANTQLNRLDTWMPDQELTQVFDGFVKFGKGDTIAAIQLDKPFIYEGGNLVIMTIRPTDTQTHWDAFWQATQTPHFPARTCFYYSDTAPLNYTQAGTPSDCHPNIIIRTDTEAGSMSGTVTVDGAVPVENALIEIEGTDLKQMTGENGEYLFDFVLPDEYTVKASKHGHFDDTEEAVTVAVAGNSEVNFTLPHLPVYTVSGNVKGNDAPNGLEGVEVTLSGYDSYTATTDANGDYTIAGVFDGFSYTVNAKLNGYILHTDTVEIDGGNAVYNITLNEVPYPVGSVTATINGGSVDITWPAAVPITEFRYDNGTCVGDMGFSDYYGNVYPRGVTGAAHNVPATLDRMSWFLTEAVDDRATTVNVYVFALNEEGLPTTDTLFHQSDVPSTKLEWNTFEFPEPVEALNGFYIALGHSTAYLAIGVANPDENWPFHNGTQFFSTDFAQFGFTALENNTTPANFNFMIRAEGNAYGEKRRFGYPDALTTSTGGNAAAQPVEPTFNRRKATVTSESVRSSKPSPKSLQDYVVYRVRKGEAEADWTELSTTSELAYTDTGWNDIAWGEYRYAVKARYTDDVLSEARMSSILEKDMYVNFTVNITTNTGEPATGATVKLKNSDGNFEHVYDAVSGNGGILIENVWRGDYSIKAALDGFQRYSSAGLDITEAGAEHDVLLNEMIYPAGTVTAELNGATESVTVNWNESVEKTCTLDDGTAENAMSYEPFNDVSNGNQFNVDGDGVITSVDIYAQYSGDNSNKPLTVDIYNAGRQLVGSSAPFVLEGNDWVNVPVDNIPFSGSFYVMVHWPATEGRSHRVGYDQNGPHAQDMLDWFFIYGMWMQLHSTYSIAPGALMIRTNTVVDGEAKQFGYGHTRKAPAPAVSQPSFDAGSLAVMLNVSACTSTAPLLNAATPKAALGYAIYRLAKGQDEADWMLLSEEETERTFTDTKWSDMENGTAYQYAVKVKYVGDILSISKLSNELVKGRIVTVKVSTSTGEPAAGASVTLTSHDAVPEHAYSATVVADSVLFTAVMDGTYTLSAAMPGFTCSDTVEINSNITLSAVLGEIMQTPFGLEIAQTGNTAERRFSWNNIPVLNEFTDDMESHSDFAVENIGNYTLTDIDGSQSYGISNVSWANMNLPGSFIVFNPSATTPAINTPDAAPHSGSRYLACFSALSVGEGGTGYNNDWLILPEVTAAEGMKFTFWAKSFNTEANSTERIKVALSTDGADNTDNFTVISESDYIEVPSDAWTEYSYDLSEYAGQDIYLAINCVSIDAWFLMIDDISVAVPDSKSAKAFEHYAVYLDGQLAGTTQDTEYLFTGLTGGTHTAGVKAVYAADETQTVTIEFDVESSSINGNTIAGVRLYPNPFTDEITVSNPAAVRHIQIMNAAGQKVKDIAVGGKTISTGELSSGVYFVTIETTTGEKAVYKMIKK